MVSKVLCEYKYKIFPFCGWETGYFSWDVNLIINGGSWDISAFLANRFCECYSLIKLLSRHTESCEVLLHPSSIITNWWEYRKYNVCSLRNISFVAFIIFLFTSLFQDSYVEFWFNNMYIIYLISIILSSSWLTAS